MLIHTNNFVTAVLSIIVRSKKIVPSFRSNTIIA